MTILFFTKEFYAFTIRWASATLSKVPIQSIGTLDSVEFTHRIVKRTCIYSGNLHVLSFSSPESFQPCKTQSSLIEPENSIRKKNTTLSL